MSYFEDVYLTRINRFGTSLQQRIVNQKEHDFNHFVQKSPNRVLVYMQDRKFEGVLQTKTYNEIETIDYFLTYKSIPISIGDILCVEGINRPEEHTNWIVIEKADMVSAGYYKYTVVKLDREIRWITEEGLLFRALVHISGAGASALNKRITSTIKVTNESVVYVPNQNLTLTMQDHDKINRGIRVNIKDQIWKISGYDNISNEGVCYVTLEQDYIGEQLDKSDPTNQTPPFIEGIADAYKLEQWGFESDLREITEAGYDYPVIEIPFMVDVAPNFRASYFNKTTKDPIVIESEDKTVVRCKGSSILQGKKIGETTIVVKLMDSPDIQTRFIVRVIDGAPNGFSVESAARMKYGVPFEFTSANIFSVQDVSFENNLNPVLGKDYLISELKPIEKEDENGENHIVGYSLQMTVFAIDKITINFVDENQQNSYEKILDCESLWLGG